MGRKEEKDERKGEERKESLYRKELRGELVSRMSLVLEREAERKI